MPHVNKALLRGVMRLREEAKNGSPEANAKLMELRARAIEGEPGAEAAINTFAVLHFQEQHPEEWKAVMAIREGVANHDPTTIQRVSAMTGKAKAGDANALRHITMLNAHSRAQALSAWARPSVGDEDGNTRVRNHTTMIIGSSRVKHPVAFGQVPQLTRRIAVGGDSISQKVSTKVSKFLALTPDKERQLIAMMLRGATSRGSTTFPPSTSPYSTRAATASSSVRATTASIQAVQAANIQAMQAANTTNAQRYSTGQMIANMNPAIAALRDKRSQGSDWLLGFYIGTVVSMGNTTEGPGQNAIRDSMFGDIPNEPMRGSLRHSGFAEARAQQYEFTRNGTPILLPGAARVLGRVKAPPGALVNDTHTSVSDPQQGICEAAASAKARNSPAAPALIAQCAARRRENILAGLFVGDKFTPNEASLRVALTDAGDAIIAKNPKMEAFRQTLPGTHGSGQQRGFTMAMAVRAGNVDPNFIEFIKPGLAVDPELLKGFLNGMAM